MFKQLFLNKDYSFDINGNFKFKNNIIESDEVIIQIEINNVNYKLSKIWLGLISHYEVELSFEQIRKITFIECLSNVIKLKCKNLMIIERPIIIDNGFRVIPGFTHFAINKNGAVISLNKRRYLHHVFINAYGYPTVNMYDADKGNWRPVTIHLLLARAFILNNDPSEKFFVNHKDCNKLNYKLCNLELVTSYENITHAFSSGLRKDNIRCMIRDCITKEITFFSSIGNALSSIEFKSKSVPLFKKFNGIVIPHLLKNRYEIKHINDKSDWYYTTEERINNNNCNVGPYQAKNIKTNIILEENTIRNLSFKTGVSKITIESAIKHSKFKVYNDYLFRTKSELEWPDTFSIATFDKPRSFIIVNVNTGEEIKFNSSTKLRRYTGIDKKTLKNRLQSNKQYKEWIIKEIF